METMDLSIVQSSTDLIQYDPNKGLKKITVAEGAEGLFRRAKDMTGHRRATEIKLTAMGEYIVWRDSVVVPSQKSGGRVSILKSGLPKADPGNLVAHRWRKAVCRKTASGTVIDPVKLARALETALPKCQRVVEQEPGQRCAGGSGEIEIYTPEECMKFVHRMFGGVPDLDPASCQIANRTVKARRFFTKTDNGLWQEWHADNLFANFPYSSRLHRQFIAKLITEYQSARVKQAIILARNADAAWFHAALAACASVCFPFKK
jgi:hypothetical protein